MSGATSGAPAILIVDDEPVALRSMRRVLNANGYDNVIECDHGEEALARLVTHPVALVLLDLIMPGMSGEQFLKEAAPRFPEIPIIVVTAQHDVATAVRCMKLGAIDFLLKPVDADHLIGTIARAVDQSALRFESARLREQFFEQQLHQDEAFADIITADPAMLRLFAYLEAISRGGQPVLIVGETGTGKELIARALHRVSGREGPMMAVNVAGLDDSMFSDTLFGHVKGAFTGATESRRGNIEQAGAGTLFLDEIGALSEPSQVKLLRLLQEREYFPLGSDRPRTLKARVIAATHQDLSMLRQDLYFRLRAYQVSVPPLRDRLGDLPALVDHFLAAAAEDLGKPKPTVPGELFLHLSNYDFPGNVRELQAIVFGAVAQHERGVMPLKLFLDQIADAGDIPNASAPVKDVLFPFPMPDLSSIERAAVDEALHRVDGNHSAAARMLGISRPTILRRVKEGDTEA